MPKKHTLEFELKIKKELENNSLHKNIIEKHKCTPVYINKIAKKYNLTRSNMDYSEIIKFNNATFETSKTSSCGKKEKYYNVTCSCGEKNEVPSFVLKRLFDKKRVYMCDRCSKSKNTRYNRASKQKKKSNNTTGYIGIFIRKNHKNNSIWGYQASLVSKNKTILRNRYKDETLHKKTLIQAAVDRDIFIIEKNLPHRRNFTDIELIANMEYLAYDQVKIIKLREGRI